MDAFRRTIRALAAGTAAGLAALAVDELLAVLTLGYPVPLGARFVAAYLALGALLALAIDAAMQLRRRPANHPAWIFAVTAAAIYAPAIFERVYHVLGHRAGSPTAIAAATLTVAGYGFAIIALGKVAAPKARGLAPLLGALAATTGLAVNRNLVDYPMEPLALAADGAVLAAALALAWIGRKAGMRRALLVLAALVAGTVLLTSAGWWKPATPGGGGSARRPNLVLVVVDTLRHDVFQAVLRETEEGRAFQQAIGGAAWFTQAIAASPWTVPSIGSIMTGLYPQEHGFAAAPVKDPSRPLTPLPATVPTLAEHLRDRGYWTEAIGTNPLLQPVSGIARGFANYEILSGPTVKLPPLTALARLGLVQRDYYQPADAVRRRLGRRLRTMGAAGQPVFLWLHVLEPHSPLQTHRNLTPDPAAAALEPLQRLYREEVRYALVELERMFQLLRDRGLWDDTVLVVVSDHGEMFPSDGHDNGVRKLGSRKSKLYGHGHALYSELVRVPLVIRPPGGLPADRRVHALTSHVDLYDTVADLLHLDVLRPGHDRVSLAPWLASKAPETSPPRRIYTLIGATQHGPPQRALRTPYLKLIDYLKKPRPSELYEIHSDPRERRNIAGANAERLAKTQRRLGRLWSRLGEPPTAQPAELDADTLERLRALGYVP